MNLSPTHVNARIDFVCAGLSDQQATQDNRHDADDNWVNETSVDCIASE